MMSGSRWGSALLALAVLAATGCGSGSKDPGPPSPDVTGTMIDTFWQDDGSAISRPAVPTGLAISAYVPLAGGGYRVVPGTIGADGHFSIPGVGFDTYFLARQQPGGDLNLTEERARVLDLGRDLTGRPDYTRATAPTSLSFQLTGLRPWAADDRVMLTSTGAHLSMDSSGGSFTVGATEATVPFQLQYAPLPQAGDLGWIVQQSVVTPTPGGPSHKVVTRYAMLQAVASLADGDVVTLGPVPLSPPPASATVGLDVRGSEFAALTPQLGASTVTPKPTYVSLYASPRGPFIGPATQLLQVNSGTPAGDVDFGTLSVPRFLPSSFVEWRRVEWGFSVDVPGQPRRSWLGMRYEPLAGADSVIRPTLGPARALRIGELDLGQPQAGVGLTPTITWSPPALGSPTHYGVSVHDETAGASGGSGLFASTTRTSFELPAGILQPGRTYRVTVWSDLQEDRDPAAPFRSQGWSTSTAAVSETFTP